MASDSVTRVCLLGHSYIRRLRDFIDSNVSYKNLNLDPSFVVDIRARGGLTFRKIPNCLEFLNFTSPPPSICFMQLGSNDLCTDTPEKVVKNILAYASYLKEGVGMQQIIVGQLLRRQPWASTPTFNEDVVRTNILLKEQTKDMAGINFWAHRGFWADLTYLGRDGVHIEGHSRHMRKFMHSIRIAVIQFSRPVNKYRLFLG